MAVCQFEQTIKTVTQEKATLKNSELRSRNEYCQIKLTSNKLYLNNIKLSILQLNFPEDIHYLIKVALNATVHMKRKTHFTTEGWRLRIIRGLSRWDIQRRTTATAMNPGSGPMPCHAVLTTSHSGAGGGGSREGLGERWVTSYALSTPPYTLINSSFSNYFILFSVSPFLCDGHNTHTKHWEIIKSRTRIGPHFVIWGILYCIRNKSILVYRNMDKENTTDCLL